MAAATFALSGCAGPAEDDVANSNLAATVSSADATEALHTLERAVATPASLVTIEAYGDEDEPTRIMAIVSNDVDADAKGLDHDPSKLVIMKGQTFAYVDPKTGGIAVIGNERTQESDIGAMLDDLRGEPADEPAGGLEIQGLGSEAVATSLRAVSAQSLKLILKLVRETAARGMKQPVAKTEELASATAKAVAEATQNVPTWVARMAKATVTGTLKLENVSWDAVTKKLTTLGTKAVFLGDDGAKAYVRAVADDKPIMVMTHSGKLSDTRLADAEIGPALRAYVERAQQFMPDVLERIAKKEGSQLVIGGGTLEGGQIVAYRAAAAKGITADSVMSGKGVDYVMDGKIAPSRNVAIQGADWGGESQLATDASRVGFVWGGGDQALAEATRLLASGKPVYVIREANALANVPKMPNAAASLTPDSLPAGVDRSLLHVFETWEEALRALP